MSAERQPHPDLEALRRTEPVHEAPRRPWLPRITALVLVLGLLGAAYAVLQPVLFPPKQVRVSAVRTVTTPGSVRTATAPSIAAPKAEACSAPDTAISRPVTSV